MTLIAVEIRVSLFKTRMATRDKLRELREAREGGGRAKQFKVDYGLFPPMFKLTIPRYQIT